MDIFSWFLHKSLFQHTKRFKDMFWTEFGVLSWSLSCVSLLPLALLLCFSFSHGILWSSSRRPSVKFALSICYVWLGWSRHHVFWYIKIRPFSILVGTSSGRQNKKSILLLRGVVISARHAYPISSWGMISMSLVFCSLMQLVQGKYRIEKKSLALVGRVSVSVFPWSCLCYFSYRCHPNCPSCRREW